MRIKIDSDVFDILERIKEIDEGYYLIYNTQKLKYEVHNSNQKNSYCLTIPYDCIDNRIIELLYKTNVSNIDKILEEIDKNNLNIEENANRKINTECDYKLREIYKFASNSSKELDYDKAFIESWR